MELYEIEPFEYRRGPVKPAIKGYSVAADRRTLSLPYTRVSNYALTLNQLLPAADLDLDNPAVWDDTQYATAATRAGKDFCWYLLSTGAVTLSANATAPTGHTTSDSMKLGGFHCLYVSVGVIAGHTLTGFVAGDILPASVWDLGHRPTCDPAGMVYCAELDLWVDIYLQSGTGASTASVPGATITDTRIWNDHVDDLAAVGKILLDDTEFQIVAEGSNQKTNIAGGADPVTTGGHVDTASRRMVSNFGLEDCCGAMFQWLRDQSYRNDDASYLGTWSYYTIPGNKGSIYRQGGTGDIKLLAGGDWYNGAACGSRCRSASDFRWNAATSIGSRGCARRQGV